MSLPIPVAPFHSIAHTAAQASIGPRDHASRTTSFAFLSSRRAMNLVWRR
jgi:hypothetical protein